MSISKQFADEIRDRLTAKHEEQGSPRCAECAQPVWYDKANWTYFHISRPESRHVAVVAA